MIRFAAPEWFLLVPLLVIVGFAWRSLRLWLPLRALCLALLVLALTQPEWRRLGRGLDLWVLVDRSASAADGMAAREGEYETLLNRSKGPDDRLFFVDYADVPVVRAQGTGDYSESVQATRTQLALRHALAQMSTGRAARILAITDGYSTESLGDIGERLMRQRVGLDYRLVTPPSVTDYGIDDLRLPARVLPGEPFILELDVTGTPDATVPFAVRRDGQPLSTGEVAVRDGKGQARFTDRLANGGAHRYEVRLTPANDARAGNNLAENWIEVVAGPRLLLVTNYPDDPVAGILRRQGFDVQATTDYAALNAGSLTGTRAVVLNNVPAFRLPAEFLNALDLYVQTQGGGLLMAGGQNSFGSGGYFQSAVDSLLPVSMELRMEHRKLAVALAIVMDRSGSMSASVAPGVEKIDLADEGAARAIDLLGPQDAVTVFAVDTEPHVVLPLTRLGNGDRGALTNTVRRVGSEGGGIYVYVGLKAGWEELKKSAAGQRHLILFSDAADSVEPGDYQALVGEMVAGGTTISVIGLGSEQDKDAGLLKDIAERGGGRVFFNSDATALPALFAQETATLARSAFMKEPVAVKPTAGWLELAARPLSWLPEVDGYNLSYLKPDATAAAFSGDEYAAPLVAYWQRGQGRTAAVSFPLGGEYSHRVRGWTGYGDFLQTLTRWLMGSETPAGLALRPRVNGSSVELDLLYSPAWEERLAKNAPQLIVAEGAKGTPQGLVWERLEPGRLHASMPLRPGQWVRGAVQVEKYTLPFGPVASGVDPEWRFDRARIVELQAVAQASGGGAVTDLSKVWQAPRQPEFRGVRVWLLGALLAVFLVDVLATRLGWRTLPTLPQGRRAVS